jgi:hypothetical protein
MPFCCTENEGEPEKRSFDNSAVSMDDRAFLAAPPSERNSVFEVIGNPLLQVNHL